MLRGLQASQRSPCCSMNSKFPSAGVVAAFLSALHPWHIRYASEARAYAFVLCLIPLVIYFFLRALEKGLWRWWAAFGTAEFFLMYSYPTCVRSEEHTSELQSLMRISYAVFCLKKKKK